MSTPIYKQNKTLRMNEKLHIHRKYIFKNQLSAVNSKTFYSNLNFSVNSKFIIIIGYILCDHVYMYITQMFHHIFNLADFIIALCILFNQFQVDKTYSILESPIREGLKYNIIHK